MGTGDRISRIGGEDVDGVVARVVVDMGGEPGTVLAVKVGETTRLVCAEACELCAAPCKPFEVPIELIPLDGATMPCADGIGADCLDFCDN